MTATPMMPEANGRVKIDPAERGASRVDTWFVVPSAERAARYIPLPTPRASLGTLVGSFARRSCELVGRSMGLPRRHLPRRIRRLVLRLLVAVAWVPLRWHRAGILVYLRRGETARAERELAAFWRVIGRRTAWRRELDGGTEEWR